MNKLLPSLPLLVVSLIFVQCASSEVWEVVDSDVAVGEESLEYEGNKIIKAKVALYMESLCPGCHQFLKKQLYPVFMKYPRYIQLDLLPFGNARHSQTSNGSWVFQCQHGTKECLGNLYLACATHLLQEERPKHLIRYYNCLADSNSYSIEQDVKKCAPVAGINFRKLDKCVQTKGPEILAKFGDRTDALKGRRYVPTVVIDDNFDINTQNDIQDDLQAYLCNYFKGQKPADCENNETAEPDDLEKHDDNPATALRCAA